MSGLRFKLTREDGKATMDAGADAQLLHLLLAAVRSGNAIQGQIRDKLDALDLNISYANLRGQELLEAGEKMERLTERVEAAAKIVETALGIVDPSSR